MKSGDNGQLPSDLKRWNWSEKVKLILSKITKIEAKLHAIRLSGKCNYNLLKDKFGPLYDHTEQNWNPSYDKKYIKNFPSFLLEAMVNPTKWQYMPPAYISIYPNDGISVNDHKEILLWLNNRFSKLNISLVEYAIDVFCSEPSNVMELFKLILKCLYIPHQKKVIAFGGQELNYPQPKRLNYGCHIGNANTVYERGPNRKKALYGWPINTLDRVRLEHSAKNSILKNHGIAALEDIIRNPGFENLNKRRWQFRCFNSTKLPAPYDRYIPIDLNSNLQSFQLEYRNAQRRVKNISQYLEDLKEFKSLESKLKNAVTEFDNRWGNGEIR